MKKNRYQVEETRITDPEGNERRAWNVTDTTDRFIQDTFTTKADATYYARKWSWNFYQ